VNAIDLVLDTRTRTCRHTRVRRRAVSVFVLVASLSVSLILGPGARVALARNAHVFSVGLLGEPEVGCIVTTGEDACGQDVFRGMLVAEGDARFDGEYEFSLPGLRGDERQPLRRRGRGRLDGRFTSARGATPVECSLRGRMRTQGVFLPVSGSTRRFYTGVFEGRGQCAGRRVKIRAIWSGSIGPVEAPMTFDFERFQGRLAGTVVFQ
jgi:hypothetical protein